MRLLTFCGLLAWAGATLLLSRLAWFARRPLAERLRPYAPGPSDGPRRGGMLSVATFGDVIAPLSQAVGGRLSRLFGIREDLGTRLRRIHSPLDVAGFRTRQFGWTVGAFGIGGLAALGLEPAPAVGVLLVVGAPLLAFLLVEQQVQRTSADWQRRLFLELPVISEQIGMLLSAGYSLNGALNRVATRSRGAVGRDLGRVCDRVRQGLTERRALHEWAELADVVAVTRLVQVLSLNQEATDLGRLIAEEARGIRRDVQRERIEQIERRGQMVWVPVTVATLVPGVIFLAVPFTQAMRLLAGS